jgi:hypothetical protein
LTDRQSGRERRVFITRVRQIEGEKMLKKWISPIVVLVVVLLAVALVPAASHAAVKRGVAKPVSVIKGGKVSRVYADGTSSENDMLCLLHENAINKSLDQAKDAAANGDYGKVPGLLKDAATMAADAQNKGCNVKF